MLETIIKIGLWIVGTLILAIGAITIGNDHDDEVDGALAKACGGSQTNRKLNNALFSARALSNGGADPICTPPQADGVDDDDSYGVTLSRSPSARAEAMQFEVFGEGPRRR